MSDSFFTKVQRSISRAEGSIMGAQWSENHWAKTLIVNTRRGTDELRRNFWLDDDFCYDRWLIARARRIEHEAYLAALQEVASMHTRDNSVWAAISAGRL